MASFADEIREATKLLANFNGALRRAGGGAGGAAGGGAGGGLASMAGVAAGSRALAAAGPAGVALGAAAAAGEALAAGARFLTPAASAYAVTGTSQGFASAITKSTLSAIQDNAFGGLLLGATGVSAAMDTNQRAGQGVLNTTEDLARIGVDVSDSQRKRLFELTQAQEKRVTTERGKVAELADSADALAGAKPAGAGGGFDAVVSAIQSLEATVKGFVGGRN